MDKLLKFLYVRVRRCQVKLGGRLGLADAPDYMNPGGSFTKVKNIGLQFLASGLSYCEKHMQKIT